LYCRLIISKQQFASDWETIRDVSALGLEDYPPTLSGRPYKGERFLWNVLVAVEVSTRKHSVAAGAASMYRPVSACWKNPAWWFQSGVRNLELVSRNEHDWQPSEIA
jgi:hypothetical protein